MIPTNENKYQMALELTIKNVAELVSANHGWTINRTLETISQLEVFDRLSDVRSSLWTISPLDLTEMIETELRGDKIAPHYYF